MKAKDLIKMLQQINPESNVVTSGFDGASAASEFTLEECGVAWNQRKATSHFAAHDFDDDIAPNAYLLSGEW